MVISYITIRRILGLLALFLPFILAIGTIWFGNCSTIERSMSAYYYTVTGHVFIAILFTFALFLFTYKGNEVIDTVMSNIAAVCALGIAFFPTTYGIDRNSCIVLTTESKPIISNIHFISAALFFIILAYMSYFLFTKSAPHPTNQKKKRNTVYRICAWIMILSILLIPVYELFFKDNTFISNLNPVFLLETLALWAFGVSWLVKGETILRDKKK